MKIKIGIALIAVALSGFVPASAADNSLDWPPSFDGTAKLLGMHIQDDFGVGMTNRLSKAIIPGPQPYCTSLDDPACTSLKENWWILRVLPPCIDTTETDDCVAGLEVSKGGETRKSVLMERVLDRTWTADKTRGLPIAGSQGLWSDPFSDDSSKRYFVNVYGDLNGSSNGSGPFNLTNFFSSITATSDSSSGSGTCIWRLGTRCGHRVLFGDGVRFSLVLHLSPSLTGWLGGRLNAPAIAVKALNPSVNEITISGEPMNVNVVGAAIPYASAPQDLLTYMKKQNPGCPSDECNVGTFSSGPFTFDLMDKWKSITKDTASRTIPYWSISRSPTGDAPARCVGSGFVGLVTTNATAYQQSMPSLNGGELTYKVSGTHFMTDGVTLSQGTYNLLLRSDVARCVYKFSKAPIRASVSIVNESDIQSVATEVVNEKDGWMYLSANGFHFSEPSIKVKLSQEAAALPTPEMTTQASPQIPAKKVTITCAKGKVKKKITATKPICPSGYKKVA